MSVDRNPEIPEMNIHTNSIFKDVIDQIDQYESRNGKSAIFTKQGETNLEGVSNYPGNISTILDAFTGGYNNERSTTVLEEGLHTGIDRGSDVYDVIRHDNSVKPITLIHNWLEDKKHITGTKLKHSDLFGLMMEVHDGNVTSALRDTMLFFHSELREKSRRRSLVKIGDKLLEARYFSDVFEPISPNIPFPADSSQDPDKDINNRMGEFYHQYWILYLLNKYPPQMVKLMLSTEYVIFGKLHGKIKKSQDEALIDDFANNMDRWNKQRPKSALSTSKTRPLVEVILADTGRCNIYDDNILINDTPQYLTREIVVLKDGIYYIDSTYDTEKNELTVNKLQRFKAKIPESDIPENLAPEIRLELIARGDLSQNDGILPEGETDERNELLQIQEDIRATTLEGGVEENERFGEIMTRYIETYRRDIVGANVHILPSFPSFPSSR